LQQIDSEIIVVDNNSEDDSCTMVNTHFPNVKLIENKDNSGFSKGNNIGVAQAQGEFVCILNPDTVVAEDTFTQLLEFAKTQSNLGMLGCRLIDGKGNYLPESKRNIPLVSVAFQKMIGDGSKYYANHLEQLDTGKIEILVGAFMLMKREVYNAVHGFDEDYFMYGEDVDLSYKVLKAGYDNYYYGKTAIIHYKGESTLKDKTYAKRFYGAMQLFYKKHFKKNRLFDTLVWFGIRLAYLTRRGPAEVKSNPSAHILVSQNASENLQKKISNPLQLKSSVSTISETTEVIFDANYCSYKEIIAQMSRPEVSANATFKILPRDTNFIIGSNDSKNRGEVIHF
jgi:GT2 family glycosyltransferase